MAVGCVALLLTELFDFGCLTFFAGMFNFRLHVTLDLFLASWIARISARTGVSVSIRVFCRFLPPEDFLAPAFGMGLNFSRVTGDG